MPRGAGGIPTSSNRPSVRLSAAMERSPCSTWMLTAGWLSAAVEKIWLFFVGIVVFFSISFVSTPPSVSMPSDRGVTSRSRTSFTSPARTPPWIAAPTATTSSGLTPLWGSFPKISLTFCWTRGMRVIPPTRMTSSICAGVRLASFRAVRQGPSTLSTRSSTSASSFARVSLMFICLGPPASAVMKGRLTSVSMAVDSSILAFSAASLRRCRAILSLRMSMPWSFLNSVARNSMSRWSKSSPPRWVSPLVDLTSKTPSPSSRIEMSNVPPPRSKTAIFSSFFLSRPYARAAAVGSLMIRSTFRPEILPASLVACRWESLK